MKSKVLFMREPEISTYTSYGSLFSIMDSDLWPWIFSNFIQIRYAHNWNILVFDSHHILLKNCPGISFYDLPQDIVISKWGKSLKKIIIDAINLEYYLYIYVDRYHIKNTDSYMKSNFIHEIFIYGYDSVREIVYVADNLQDGKFIKTVCSFDELEKGYWSIKGKYEFWTEIRFLKTNKLSSYEFNLEQMVSNLEDYLYSKKRFDLIEEQKFDFGFKAIDRLLENIDRGEENRIIDIRGFHLLFEHKIIMEKRLNYLIENQYIKHEIPLFNYIIKLKQDYILLRNLILKFNITKDKNLITRIRIKLQENLIEEKEFIYILIQKIKNNKHIY